MNIKKEAYDVIIQKFRNEYHQVQSKINKNLYEFKRLSQEQSRLKRERAILMDTIKSLDAKAQDVITK